jgi:hypothetical protein
VSDAVNHPDHYGGDEPYEVIKVLRAWDLELARGFCWGNLIKYTARASKKGAMIEDRKKAQWYADELVSIEEELAGPQAVVPCTPNCPFEPWESSGGGGVTGTIVYYVGTDGIRHNHSFPGNCDPGCPGWKKAKP